MTNVQTAQQVAATFVCTIQQAKTQMLNNAVQLRKLAEQASATKKVRGYTRDQLIAKAVAFELAAA
jgi:hypothetical protein